MAKIEAVMSVPPINVTEPRRVRQVLFTETDSNSNVQYLNSIRGCYQIVLYYEELVDKENGWSLTGWIVESLAGVLLEHPLVAGRLQRKENEDGDNKGFLEIVSNDSGIRILEARFPMNLSDFLALSHHEKEKLEAELVFWKEIDDQSPEFSPLFYVQVTNFECGGYSIGISCSLLLAEVLIVDNFLKKWADIHNTILPQKEEIKTPIFYHPRLKNPESPPTDLISRTPSKNGARSMVFIINAQHVNFNMELWRELAFLCVEEAEQKVHKKLVGSDFALFLKESSKAIKVEGYSKSGYSEQVLGLKKYITDAKWENFGVYDVAFHEGIKPSLISRWIGSNTGGHVMVVPYPKENVSAVIIVSVPVEEYF